MSLKPRRILFDEVWGCLRKTVEEVITLKTVNRDDWNNSFKWDFFCFLFRRWTSRFSFSMWHNFICLITDQFSLSSDVYSICVAYPDPLADRLYSETKLFLENHVKTQLEVFGVYMMEVNDTDNSQNQLLHNYFNAWKNYSQGLEYLNFLYL